MTEKQQELFTEFKDGGTRKKYFGKGILPDSRFTIVFTYERLILATLAVIVVLSVMFAFGFECGKKKGMLKTAAHAPLKVKQKPSKPAGELYTVQVATFNSRKLAQEEAEKLKVKRFATEINETKGFYQVRVGKFANKKEALRAQKVLKENYKDCFIKER